MKKIIVRENIILLLILLSAFVLRVLCIDKVDGLWYDELVSYKEVVMPNVMSVIRYTLKTDVHLPLYQVLLHFWTKLFASSDLSLRMFSVICGFLSVVISYFIGKELKGKILGLFCAGVFAFNSFLIYYSQEVRMYSMLILFATLHLFFSLRVQRQHGAGDYIGLALSSIALVYTQTIAFIYVFLAGLFQIIFMWAKKFPVKNILISYLVAFVATVPLIFYVYVNWEHYSKQINGYYCDWSSLLVVLSDFFTPKLQGLNNNPMNYFGELINNFTLEKLLFTVIPSIVCLYAIGLAIRKNKRILPIFLTAICFWVVEILAFKFTNFKILSRYLSITLPVLLVMVSIGLRWTKFRRTIVLGMLILSLGYLIFSPNSAFKMSRGGYKVLANILIQEGVKDNDYVLVWNRREVLDKYIDKKLNTFGILGDVAYRNEVMLQNEARLNKMPIEKRKIFLRDYLTSPSIPYNTLVIMSYVFNHMEKEQKFIITTNEEYDQYTQSDLDKLRTDDAGFNKISLNTLLTVKSLLDIKGICNEYFLLVSTKKENSVVVYVYMKKNP